jgi:hypothetical protein
MRRLGIEIDWNEGRGEGGDRMTRGRRGRTIK